MRSVPGVFVSQTSVPGSITQIRIRGAEANHTLVIIDGIEVSDVGNSSEFDFAHLQTSEIERIEIIRGPQSALFGSDAIGGVINITTKKGNKEDSFTVASSIEGGSFDTAVINASVRNGTDWYHLSVFGSNYRASGENIAREGSEKDGYRKTSVGLTAGLIPSENTKIDLALRFNDGETETDEQLFNFSTPPTLILATDADNQTDFSQIYGRIQGSLTLLDNRWKHIVGIAITDTDNDFFIDGAFDSGNKGQRRKYDYQTTYTVDTPKFANSTHNFTLAYEREELRFRNIGTATFFGNPNQKQAIDQDSVIGEYRVNLFERLSLSNGFRYDDNERFDNSTTYRFTFAYQISAFDARIHGSYGTGIVNPTFFELFGFTPNTFAGNPDLQPEKSHGIDIGVEKHFGSGRYVVDLIYFNMDLEDEIIATFDIITSLSGVANADAKSDRQGVELSGKAKLTDNLTLSGSFTFSDSEDGKDGKEELRRPSYLASAAINYSFRENRANVNIGLDYVGERDDNSFFTDFSSRRQKLNDYYLVSIATTYKASENMKIFAKIENLLDEEYEEAFSFQSTGIGFFSGIRLQY